MEEEEVGYRVEEGDLLVGKREGDGQMGHEHLG